MGMSWPYGPLKEKQEIGSLLKLEGARYPEFYENVGGPVRSKSVLSRRGGQREANDSYRSFTLC
jgi:hypothetical protein